MGGERFVVKALGALVAAVILIGGAGTLLVMRNLGPDEIGVAFLFGPLAVISVVAMALLWVGATATIFLITRSRGNRQR